MRVVLPAPFSPRSACTSPRATSNETSSFAMTPGNRLVIPRIATAAAPRAAAGRVPSRSISARRGCALALGAPDDPLDEPVDREDLLQRHPLALRDAQLAGLVVERPLELVERPVDDLGRFFAISAFVFALTFGPNGAIPARPSFMLP